MDDTRSTATVPLLIVVLLALTVGSYVVAYLTLGRHGRATTGPFTGAIVRTYPKQWQAKLFEPAAMAESFVFRRTVYTGY